MPSAIEICDFTEKTVFYQQMLIPFLRIDFNIVQCSYFKFLEDQTLQNIFKSLRFFLLCTLFIPRFPSSLFAAFFSVFIHKQSGVGFQSRLNHNLCLYSFPYRRHRHMDHCSLLFLPALFSTFTSILSNNFLILLTNKNTLQRRHLSVFIKHFHIQWVNKVSHKLMFSLALVFLFWSCIVLVLVVDVGFWKQFKASGTKSRYFSNIARKLLHQNEQCMYIKFSEVWKRQNVFLEMHISLCMNLCNNFTIFEMKRQRWIGIFGT